MLDLSRILAGPWATQVLADFGAEVLKVEHPRGGDDTRKWGPPYLRDAAGRETDRVRVLPVRQPRQALARHRLQPARGPGTRAPARGRGRTSWSRTSRSAASRRHGLAYADLAAD